MLITGGCGFIGSNFILKMISKNHTIINIDKLTYASNIHNLSSIQAQSNYKHLNVDICDEKSILDIVIEAKPDIIIHFAAESHVDRSISEPEAFIHTNVKGTVSLLNASLALFKDFSFFHKFLHISTDEVFGSLDTTDFFNEKSLYRPNLHIQHQKLAQIIL